MTFSLRAKLFSLVTASIALAAVPIIVLSYTSLNNTVLKREQSSFANMVMLVEDNISTRYLNMLTNEVLYVVHAKNRLRRVTGLARATILSLPSMPESDRQRLFTSWREPLAGSDVHLALLRKDGKDICSGLMQRFLLEDRFDMKNQPLQAFLRPGKVPAEGEFSVFRLRANERLSSPDASGKKDEALSLLVFFLPVSERQQMLVAGIPLQESLLTSTDSAESEFVSGLQERLRNLALYPGSGIAVIDGKKRIIAQRGNTAGLGSIGKESLEQARRTHPLEFTSEGTEDAPASLVRIAYFKPLDWFVVASVPLRELSASAHALVYRLVGVAFCLLLLCLLATLWLTARVTRPLRVLTGKALTVAETDFSASSGSLRAAFEADLPVERGDEVGQLSRAFLNMGQALDDNIHRLMETTSVKERMQGELNAAHDIQIGILQPAEAAPSLPDYAVAAMLVPAKEVGGDLYDYFTAPDGRQAVVIGDVSDKGVSAALFMSMTVTLVRYALSQGQDPASAMAHINNCLSGNNPSCMFVTLIIGLFDPRTGVLEYANGGHCAPLIINDKDGVCRRLDAVSGPLVGGMPDMAFSLLSAQLEEGDTCLFYTDGVSEALDAGLNLFGEERIRRSFTASRGKTPEDVMKAVYAEVLEYRGETAASDDITMLCFVRKRAGNTGSVS